MPAFITESVSIHYEVVGYDGPWIVLTPGGRGPLHNVRDLADIKTLSPEEIGLRFQHNMAAIFRDFLRRRTLSP